AEVRAGVADGAQKLAASLTLALVAGLDDHVGRAHANFAATALEARDYAVGDGYLETGIEYCRERGLDSFLLYMTGWQARSQLEQGRWDEAEATASELLAHPGVPAPTRINPLVVLGRLRARRGNDDPWPALDEALALAEPTGELQRLAPVAAARAEARWLAGERELVAAEAESTLALAVEREDAWAAGELAAWCRRAGSERPEAARVAVGPFLLELGGEPEAASRAWRELGCPYEAALALLESADERSLRRSLAELQRLRAAAAAGHVARVLRERGLRDLRTGPRAATRANPAGLTRRELDVLELLAEGHRNAHIAERLVLSAKTVDHHVSAILRKLQAATRTEAAARATQLGILER